MIWAHLCQFEFILRQINWPPSLSLLGHKLPISFHLHLMEAARQWKDSTGPSPPKIGQVAVTVSSAVINVSLPSPVVDVLTPVLPALAVVHSDDWTWCI